MKLESHAATFCDLANRKQRSNLWYHNYYGDMYICTSNYMFNGEKVFALCISNITIKEQRCGKFRELIHDIRSQYDGAIRVENALVEFAESLMRHGFIEDVMHSNDMTKTLFLPAGKTWE